jgi:hypothetical protein
MRVSLDSSISTAAFIPLERRLSRRQTSGGYAIRGTRHIIETKTVTELNAFRIATVLATDSNFEALVSLSTACNGQANETTNSFRIEYLERIFREDTGCYIAAEKPPGVVAR